MRLISGHVHRYDVIITFQSVVVIDETRIVTRQLVPEMRKFIANANIITFGWAEFPDFEVIYIYNKDDDNFGYAVNLQDPTLSEWGYAPFRN